MLAYLINLDRSPDRLAQMTSAFGRVGTDFVRVAATDGSLLGVREVDDFVAGSRGAWDKQWIRGEVGIFKSHMQTWQMIAAGPFRAGAVFEDDIALADDLPKLLASDDWIPEDADLIRLESNRPLLLRNGRRIGAAPRRKLYRVASGTWGAAGYVVTRDAAARLAEAPADLRRPVDAFLFKPPRTGRGSGLACYQVVPAVCIQEQVLSPHEIRFPSLVGTSGRQPKVPASRLLGSVLLPWRKRPVPFAP